MVELPYASTIAIVAPLPVSPVAVMPYALRSCGGARSHWEYGSTRVYPAGIPVAIFSP